MSTDPLTIATGKAIRWNSPRIEGLGTGAGTGAGTSSVIAIGVTVVNRRPWAPGPPRSEDPAEERLGALVDGLVKRRERHAHLAPDLGDVAHVVDERSRVGWTEVQ